MERRFASLETLSETPYGRVAMSRLHDLFDSISADELRRGIEELRSVELEEVPVPELRERVQAVMRGYSCSDELHAAYPIRDVWRARVNVGESLFHNARELIYPPSHVVRRMGRLNDEGQSVFYGALDKYTAILEVQPHPGDLVTVLRSRTTTPEKFRYMELGVVGHLYRNVRLISDLGVDGELKNKLIREFLVDEFSKIVSSGEEHEYKIACAVGQTFLESRAGAVLYPSIARNREAINLAMTPEKYDEHFEALEVTLFRVMAQHGPTRFETQMVGRSSRISSGGEIEWPSKVRDQDKPSSSSSGFRIEPGEGE